MAQISLCDVCACKNIRSDAVVRCEDCDQYYCESCSESHTNFGALQNHILEPIQQQRQQQASLLNRISSFLNLRAAQVPVSPKTSLSHPSGQSVTRNSQNQKHRNTLTLNESHRRGHGNIGQNENNEPLARSSKLAIAGKLQNPVSKVNILNESHRREPVNGQEEDQIEPLSHPTILDSKQVITGKYQTHFNVRLNQDLKPCHISGLTCLPNGRIVMIDSKNRKLKVFEKNYKFKMAEELPKGCRGLTFISGNEIAVAQGEKVQFFSVEDSEIVKLSKFIPIEGHGFGISYERNHYAVSFENQRIFKAVIILNKFIEKVAVIKNGDFFGEPLEISANIILDPNEDRLFIADNCTRRVLCLTYFGEPLWQCQTEYCPNGFAVINKSLLISLYAINDIQAINCENGRLVNAQLNENGGIRRPNILAYQRERKCLLVAHNIINRNEINVFSIDKDGDSNFLFPCILL